MDNKPMKFTEIRIGEILKKENVDTDNLFLLDGETVYRLKKTDKILAIQELKNE